MIEDNEDDFVLVDEFLDGQAYSLTWAENARVARALLRERSFGAILLDHGLPDTNSLSFLDELRAHYPDCPVIVLTGFPDRALAISARQKGAHSHIHKDDIAEHLLPTLAEFTRPAVSPERISTVPEARENIAHRFSDTAAEFYGVLLDTMSEGCIALDCQGCITFANRALESMVHGGVQRLLGRQAIDVFSDSSRDSLRAALDALRADPMARFAPFEARISPAYTIVPAREVTVRIAARGMRDPRGAFEAALLLVTDISDQVRARQMREDLTRTTIHDLRNPLSGIVSVLDAVKHSQHASLTEDLGGLVDIGLQSARTMLTQVSDLLSISRLEANEVPLSPRPIDLAALIEKTVRAQQATAMTRRVQLLGRVRAHVVARVDVPMIERVLQNLVDNALVASPEGGLVTLVGDRFHDPDAPSDEAGHCQITVTDQGPGISPRIAGRVFQKFFTGSANGNGLGLTFCKLVVETHGGRIWFDTAPGQGTAFHCILPAA